MQKFNVCTVLKLKSRLSNSLHHLYECVYIYILW